MSPSTHTAVGQAHTAGNVREPHTVCVSGVGAATGVAPVAATDAAGY